MRPIQQVISFKAAIANAVAASQTPNTSTGAVTINGVNAVAGVATFTYETAATIASANNLSSYTFVVSGTDANGGAVSESIAGPNNSTVTTTATFKTVTGVSSNATGLTTETLTVGSANYGYGPTDWWPLDIYNPNTATSTSVTVLSGTVTYTMEYTNEDPWDKTITQQVVNHPEANLVAANSSQTGFTFTLMRAVRPNISAGTGSVRVTVTQQSTV